jgi:hypothetical protein
MNILLAFAPFVVFAVLSHVVGPAGGLLAGTLTSVVLIARDWMRSASLKILEVGTFLLFAALTIYTLTAHRDLSIIEVRLWVDLGLLTIVLLSMAIRRPFTIQYAKDEVPAEYWNSPRFIRTNYVITAAWAVAFAVMVIAEAALLYVPGMPHGLGVAAIVLALVGAVKFTGSYTKSAEGSA